MSGFEEGFGEGFQSGFALDDATAFTRLMFELYEYRCAVTGEQFAPSAQLPHPELEIFLFLPLAAGGALSFGNATVVEGAVKGLMAKGLVVVDDNYWVLGKDGARWTRGQMLWRHADRAFWPDRALMARHREYFQRRD
ncbi:hypothetical protein DEVEQU_02673 [Devosia equisanguinis]|uniref:Uncharacterized protein n=1 Tax=Devosia equisanguinis TaxID=2490941 RepID=A0A3S4DRF7_9HYPH|nr:hypothetical protein [Devosia equisanguinis]VDS05531.1 hypothetical protein DEVEQU_02673 [Devosia equisanguinis]